MTLQVAVRPTIEHPEATGCGLFLDHGFQGERNASTKVHNECVQHSNAQEALLSSRMLRLLTVRQSVLGVGVLWHHLLRPLHCLLRTVPRLTPTDLLIELVVADGAPMLWRRRVRYRQLFLAVVRVCLMVGRPVPRLLGLSSHVCVIRARIGTWNKSWRDDGGQLGYTWL